MKAEEEVEKAQAELAAQREQVLSEERQMALAQAEAYVKRGEQEVKGRAQQLRRTEAEIRALEVCAGGGTAGVGCWVGLSCLMLLLPSADRARRGGASVGDRLEAYGRGKRSTFLDVASNGRGSHLGMEVLSVHHIQHVQC